MLDWIYQRFQERPNERWPWLVHAVFAARHGLHDDALAKTYAAALRTRVTDPKAPSWVAQMELLLRADLGEAEDAKVHPGRAHRCGPDSLARGTRVPGVANCGSAAAAAQIVTHSTLRLRAFLPLNSQDKFGISPNRIRNRNDSSSKHQSGYTLVEIAIVLVIIGLLLGGVLKGQELIYNQKVKSTYDNYRQFTAAMYGYQDRYKALPGDDPQAH